MKSLKIILLSIFSIIIAIYLAFLFVVPNVIDLNKYAPQIKQAVEKSTGFQVTLKDLKVKTAWNLSCGGSVQQADLKYPTGEKFAQINNLEIKLSLLPLFAGQVIVDSADLDKIILNLKVEKGGNFLIEKYLPKTDEKSAQKNAELPFGLKFSSTMPDIRAKKYKVAFIDTETGKSYAFKGTDFKISDFVLNKKIKIKTTGDLILDKRKQISYILDLYSKVFPEFGKKAEKNNIINIFEDLYKYNLATSLKADLKITGTPKKTNIDGNFDLSKISFNLNGTTLPQSNLKLKLNGDKIKIKSDFYTGLNQKALITGVFNHGNKKFIDLKVSSDKTDIGNTFLIASSLLEMFGNNDLKGITANGSVNANFGIKSDFKTIQSNGYLKINNGNITHKMHNIALNSINADLDLSENSVNIKKSSALLNNEPIILKGTIDTKANANLSIFAENIQLKGFLATLGQLKTIRENDINGLISLKANLKGRLDKAIPTVNGVLTNVSITNKPSSVKIKLTKANINAVSNGKKTNGKIEISDLKILPQIQNGQIKVLSAPNVVLNFNEKDLNIDKTLLYLNNSKINLYGKVKNYNTDKINSDITVKSLMFASDIKAMLPKANQAGVSAVGKIPVLIKITGGKKQDIHAQLIANQGNHLTVFDINSLRGKTSLINTQLNLSGNNLKINEMALYSLKTNQNLSESFKIGPGTKVATITGKILNLNNPTLKDIAVEVPNQITTSLPGFAGSNVRLKGDLYLNGAPENLSLKGYLTIPYVHIPTTKTDLRNLVVHFNNNSINANCPQLSILDSEMGFNAIISNNFAKGIIVKNIDFTSTYLNLDTLSAALSKIPKDGMKGFDISILGGRSNVSKFKTGGIVATNVTSNIGLKDNLLKLSNLRGDAFLGKVGGTITYNLITNKINLDLQGRNLSAGLAIKGLTGSSQTIVGQLDFDSKISMTGGARDDLIKSLKGSTNFIISNGKMDTLGKLEHLLYAQNIMSNSLLNASLNVVAKAITVKNTGYYKYMKGQLTFSNGWANIKAIKTSGPTMSMYITGRYYLLSNFANLTILGSLSEDVVKLLGPIGDFSVNKLLSYIPKIGVITNGLIHQITASPDYENTSMIPPLTPKTEMPTKDFKAVISGNVESQSSVKSFKWLSNAKAVQNDGSNELQPQNVTSNNSAPSTYKQVNKVTAPPDFLKALPDFKKQ